MKFSLKHAIIPSVRESKSLHPILRLLAALLVFALVFTGPVPMAVAATSTVTVGSTGGLIITNLAQSGTLLSVVAGGSFTGDITLVTGTTGGMLSVGGLVFSGTSAFQDKNINLSTLTYLQLASGGSLTLSNGMVLDSFPPASGILLGGSATLTVGSSSSSKEGALGISGGEIRVDSVSTSRGTLTVNAGTATTDTISGVYLDLGAKLDLVKNGRGILGLSSANSGGTLSVFSGTITATAGVLQIDDGFLSQGTSNTLKVSHATGSTLYPVTIALKGATYLTSLVTLGGSASNSILGVSMDASSATLTLTNDVSDSSVFRGLILDAADGSDGVNPLYLVKNGNGALLLSNGKSSFSGGLTLNAGSLILNASSTAALDNTTGITTIVGPIGARAMSIRGGTIYVKPPFDSDGNALTGINIDNALSFFAASDTDIVNITGGSLIQRKVIFASSNGTDSLAIARGIDLDSSSAISGGTALASGSVTLMVNTPVEISGPVIGDPYYGTSESGSITMSLVKTGLVQLKLSGANQYLGGFTVAQGALLLGSTGALGSVDDLGNVLTMNSLSVLSGAVLDLGGFTQAVSTPLILSGTGTGGGALTNSGDVATYSGSLTLAGPASIGGLGDITFSGAVNAGNALTKVDVNMLTFGGSSTFSGSLLVSSGTAQVGSGGTLEFASNGGLMGDLTNNGVVRFNNSTASSVTGTISGSGSLVKLGNNALTLSNGATYTGATTISAGSLIVNGGLASNRIVNFGTFTFTCSPGTTTFSGSLSGTGKSLLTSASAATVTLGAGAVVDGGSIQVGNNVTVSVTAGALLLGNLEILSGGKVSLASGVGNVFGSTTKLFVNGGVVDLKGNTVSVGTFALFNGGTFISSSGTGKIISSGGTLSVAPLSLVITTQPVGQRVVSGSVATFSVNVSGVTPITYQWRKNGSPIASGGTASVLTIPGVQPIDAGSYSVVLSNSAGTLTSGSAQLSVIVPVSITKAPTNLETILGGSSTFSVTATGTDPISYQWSKNGAAITGATASSHTITATKDSDAGNFSVIVSNEAGTVAGGSATLTVITPVSISNPPQSQTVIAGSSATLSVSASGTGPLSYQWKKGGSDISGATSATYTISSVTTSDSGSYSVAVSNKAGTLTSGSAQLSVIVPVSITKAPINLETVLGGSSSFSVVATGTSPISYQWFKNGAPISGANAASYTITATQDSDVGNYSVTVTNPAGPVNGGSGFLTLVTPVSITAQPLSQTVIAGSSATLSVSASGTGPLSYQWKKGGVDISGATSGTYSISSVTTSDSGIYSVVVTNRVRGVVSSDALVTVIAPISITSQPPDLKVVSGGSAVFTVSASGTGPLSYQWQKGVASILGATSNSYVISSVGTSDSGSYSVRITNAAGTVTSRAATLAVNLPVSISRQPTSLTVVTGYPASLRIGLDETEPVSYQIYNVVQSGSVGTSTGITGVVLQGGTYDIPLTGLTSSGSYMVRFTKNSSGGPYTQDSNTFNVTARSLSDAVGSYATLLLADSGSDDNANFRGQLSVTVSRTGAVSGRLVYNEAPAAVVDSSYREYRPVSRSLVGVLAPTAADPSKFQVTPRLGTAAVAIREELTITVDFASVGGGTVSELPAPVTLKATLKDNVSSQTGAASPWISVTDDSVPCVRGLSKLPTSMASLPGRYSIVSDVGQVANSAFEDTHAYLLVQVLSTGRLMWTTRSPGYFGTGSGVLSGTTPDTLLVAPFSETFLKSTTKSYFSAASFGWLNLNLNDPDWSAAVAGTDASIEKQYCYKDMTPAATTPIQGGVVSVPFKSGEVCHWSGTKVPSIPSYLTSVDALPALSLDAAFASDTYLDPYSWNLKFLSGGAATLASANANPKPVALQLKLDRSSGELKGSFLGSDRVRCSIFGTAYPSLDTNSPRGWVEKGALPNLEVVNWTLNSQ
jgi:autotransporter-associated beta strand protein